MSALDRALAGAAAELDRSAADQEAELFLARAREWLGGLDPTDPEGTAAIGCLLVRVRCGIRILETRGAPS